MKPADIPTFNDIHDKRAECQSFTPLEKFCDLWQPPTLYWDPNAKLDQPSPGYKMFRQDLAALLTETYQRGLSEGRQYTAKND